MARDQFLARTRFAPDQNREIGRGDSSDLFVNALHGAAAANDCVLQRLLLAHGHRMGHEPAGPDRARSEVEQFIHLEWF
jgi:hypothetical protein